MKNRTHFAHRVDAWDDDGQNVIKHLAGVEDFELAMATRVPTLARWAHNAAGRGAADRGQPTDAACLREALFVPAKGA
jgi:hypothetical protein